MKQIKIRHIIGTLAIIATVIMNFTYAHNNYGLPKMSRVTKAYATTAAPTYREELVFEYKFCDSYAYDVNVYWKDPNIFGYRIVTFTSKSMKEAYDKAKEYAQEVNDFGMDYAEVDMKCYITESYRDAHRVNCLPSGNLRYCETKDAECDPLEYNSSLER